MLSSPIRSSFSVPPILRIQGSLRTYAEVERETMLTEAMRQVELENPEPAAPAVNDEARKKQRADIDKRADELEAAGHEEQAAQLRSDSGLVAGGAKARNDRLQRIAYARLPSRSVLQELEAYLKHETTTEDDPWTWWRTHRYEYPTLARVAARVLIIPATTVPVERLFSKVKRLITPQRASLGAERIDDLMMINNNIDIFPQCLHAYQRRTVEPPPPAPAVAAADAMEH